MGILDAPGLAPKTFRALRQRDLPHVVTDPEPKTAATLPTVTFSASGAATFVTGGSTRKATNRGFFNFSDPRYVQDVNGYTQSIKGPYHVEYITDAPISEIVFAEGGGTFRVLCNNEIIIQHTAIPAGSSFRRQLIDWGGVRKTRTYRIECSQDTKIGGVGLTAVDSCSRTPFEPHTVFWGDSHCEFTILDTNANQHQGWAMVCARALGIRNPFASGSGGTGLQNPGTGGKVKLIDRVDAEIALNPARWFIAMGINDANREGTTGYTAQMQYDALTTLLTYLRAQLPYSEGGVFSPFTGKNTTTSERAFNAAQKAAAEAQGIPFYDMMNRAPLAYQKTTTLTSSASASSLAVASTTGFQTGDVVMVGDPAWTTTPGNHAIRNLTAVAGSTLSLDVSLSAGGATTYPIGTTVRNVGRAWSWGTGNVGATTAVGPSDFMVGSDATHFTLAGHLKLGQDAAAAIRAARSH